MKTLKTTLATLALFITTMTATAQPMSYYAMRENARFLTDRMAYTLGIADYLLDDLYMINYDYICGVNDYLDDVAYGYHYDDYMTVLYARDAALRRLLTPYQWTRLVALDYFYRPITFVNRRWSFGIYVHDPYRTHFYFGVPHHYSHYRGGHFFRGMAPRRDNRMAPPPVRDMGPRGGMAPAPNNGAYRGAVPRTGRVNDMAPRMNSNVNRPAAPNTNVNRNMNTNTNTNVNVNVNRNVNVNTNGSIDANRHEMRTNVNANAGNTMRSGSNVNSSSRFNGATRSTTTTAPTLPSRGSSNIGTRSSAGASMGTRGGGGAVGGRTGGGRR